MENELTKLTIDPLKIEVVSIKDVKMNENNPRFIKDDKFKKLVKSIKDFPEMLNVRPIVVDEDMIVLGGNMRLKACQSAGLKQVSIIKFNNLTEDKKKEFIVKDNVGYGEWDFDYLSTQWDSISLDEWGLDVPKFDLGNGDEPEEKDVKIHSMFQITIDFENESELKENYDRLLLLGYTCKILQI